MNSELKDKARHVKRISAIAISIALISSNVSAFAATPKLGDSCTQQNKTIKVKNQNLICKKSGSQLKWTNKDSESSIKKIPRKLIVVGLTPSNQPDFWSLKPSLEEFDSYAQVGTILNAPSFKVFGEWTWSNFLEDSIDKSAKFWANSSDNRVVFEETKLIYAPAGSAKVSRSCDFTPDLIAAKKFVGLKSVPVGTHLVSVNPFRKCPTSQGEAALRGNTITLSAIYALAHEFGHNLGFLHTSTISCEENNFKSINSKRCILDEYGDETDVMGSGPMSLGCEVSAANGQIHLGIPKVTDMKLGEITTLAPNTSKNGNILYRIRLENVWYFFEYRNTVEGGESTGCYHAGPSGIEVRFVGAKWPALNVSLLTRFMEGDGILQGTTGETIKTYIKGEPIFRFTSGETILLPGQKNNYRFTVLTIEVDKASFLVEKI